MTELEPGWLARDIKRAAARLKELTPPAKGRCPCCEQPLPAARLLVDLNSNRIAYGVRRVRVNRRTCELAFVLVAAMPREVAYDRLIARMWGSREPNDPLKLLSVYACFLRGKLHPFGFTIKSTYKVGYRIEKL